MKIRAAGLIVVAALAGCASVPGGGFTSSPSQASALRAHLLPATTGSWGYSFDLSAPAYAAVFRISPRSGATLVYPRGGQGSVDRPSNQGLTHIPGRLTRFANSRVSSVLPAHAAQPDFYLLVASEEPLDLSAIGPFGDGLRFALGTGGARFQSPYGSMERLVSLVVPDPSQNNWATDYYVDWPEVLHQRPGAGLVRVACGDVAVYVPLEMIDEAVRTLCANEVPEVDAPEEPQDSAPTALPARRDPPNLQDRIASRQLETPQEWESSMRRAGRLLSDRAFNGASTDFEGIDRSNTMRRSGRGPGVNNRAGDAIDTRAIGRQGVRNANGGNDRASSPGRAEPSRGSSGGGGDSGGRPSSNSNPAVNGNS